MPGPVTAEDLDAAMTRLEAAFAALVTELVRAIELSRPPAPPSLAPPKIRRSSAL